METHPQATVIYTCAPGQTVSGSTCVQNTGMVPATTNCSCPVNHTLSGTNCARTSDTYAALITTSEADRTVNYAAPSTSGCARRTRSVATKQFRSWRARYFVRTL